MRVTLTNGYAHFDPPATGTKGKGTLVIIIDLQVDEREVGSDKDGNSAPETAARFLVDTRTFRESDLAASKTSGLLDQWDGLFVEFGFLDSQDVELLVENVVKSVLKTRRVSLEEDERAFRPIR